MAAVLTQSNSFKLTGKIGRRPTDGELYMAHFMGVGAAAKLVSNAEDNPQASAARMFPDAAAANRSIFYDRSGNARSVSEVYSVLNARYASAASSATTRGALALYGGTPASTAVASTKPAPAIDNAAYLSSFPDMRAATPVTVASSESRSPSSSDPIFRSLFQVDDRTPTVSPTVRELWGKSSSLTSVSSTTPVAPTSSVPHGLDLFSDPTGTFSG